jgi:gliding motility-associated-like protein
MIYIRKSQLVITAFLVLYTSFVGFSNNHENSMACPNIIVSGTNVSCYGGSNGSAQVAVSGGSGNYTYSWSNGANVPSINGLSVGTYTVGVKDNVTGCSVVGAYVVGAPDPIFVSETVINVNCYGQSTGRININTFGGNGSYTYSWINSSSVVVSTNQNLAGVQAGTYTLNIKDAQNCTFSKVYTITQPAEPLNHSVTISNAKCFATPTGKIDVEVWGGTPSYTYLWDTGSNTQDISGLTEGNYSVTITDFKGCTLPLTFYVGQPSILSATISPSDVLCNGDATGSLQATPNGGSVPYSYAWKNSSTVFGINSPILTNVKADNYQLTVTDANGCSYVGNATVNQPSALTLTHTFSPISCYGGSDGSIDLTVMGGVPTYSYVWKNDAGVTVATSQDLNAVVSDIYTVTITDQNSCSKTLTQELTQPPLPIAVTETVIDVKCYGENTGEIILAVTGGTAPYSYSWTTGQSANHITGLIAMTYNYVVVDSKLCTFSNAVLISQPAQPLTITNVVTDVNCYGESNGEIDLTVSGGTTPYTYSWTNSSYNLSNTNQDLVNYPAETYTYLVTDFNNCKSSGVLTINQPTLLQSTISGVNILCKGGNNGSIDLTVTGGVTPYSYSWSNSIVTQDQAGLEAGTYSVTVTDAHNCVATNQITLTEPQDSLSYTFEVIDVRCNNGQDGEIDLTIKGGTLPYNYVWSNGSILPAINQLLSAYYEFIVTDGNGCLISDSIFVDQPNPLMLNEQITPVTCNGLSDGVIDITPTGGTQPYNYTWLNSRYVLSTQQEDLVGFPADIYQLEVIDSNNCFYEIFMEILEPDVLKLSYTTNIVSCNGGGDGNIFVTITGGNPSYTTTWSNGATTQDLLNIPAGTYELVVVDQKNCTDSFTVEITEPSPITITFETTKVSCIDQHDGTAYAIPSGGNGGYFYNWSNGSNLNLAESLSNQYYDITVVDVLGCVGQGTVFIEKNMTGCINPVSAFTPNGDNYNDTWVIDNTYLYTDFELTIFNRWGNIVYRQTGQYEPWDGKVNGADMPSDVYYYIINLNSSDREPLTGNITIVR